LAEHVVEGLQGEGRLGGLVTRAVEADHQAVADQLVAAHALDAGDVLETLGLGRHAGQQAEGEKHIFDHGADSSRPAGAASAAIPTDSAKSIAAEAAPTKPWPLIRRVDNVVHCPPSGAHIATDKNGVVRPTPLSPPIRTATADS